MKQFIPDWIQPALLGVVIGALAWWIVLAQGFGWDSASTVNQLASDAARKAVVTYAVPACVARFQREAHPADAWKTLSGTSSWEQGSFVAKSGWIGEPGQKIDPELASAIADRCATELLSLTTFKNAQETSAHN